ncbi:hypothetical protein TNCV_3018211 [Trichonephila clavipes]|nr:hypothetical protein TNCV_3018211 [Trichonephila clavipes]
MFSFLTAVVMTSYTNQEMADIHFIYGVADLKCPNCPATAPGRRKVSGIPTRIASSSTAMSLSEHKGLYVVPP